MPTSPTATPNPSARAAAGAGLARTLLAVLSLGLLVADGAAAQTASASPRLYQVEVVVFGHPPGASLEKPPARPEEPLDFLAPSVDERTESPVLPVGVSAPLAARQLDAVARRLNTGGYRLLWHQSWVQAAGARGGMPLAILAALGRGVADPALSGSISLEAGRFLHLGLELELASPDGLEAQLSERRRMRLNEQHYFDGPRVGVIALITPVVPQT
jgi:hypothetical protein